VNSDSQQQEKLKEGRGELAFPPHAYNPPLPPLFLRTAKLSWSPLDVLSEFDKLLSSLFGVYTM